MEPTSFHAWIGIRTKDMRAGWVIFAAASLGLTLILAIAGDAVAGAMQTIGLPIKHSATPGRVASPAPLFGQHTAEVLAEYGYSAAEIDGLAAAGAIHLGATPSMEAAQ